MTMTMTMTMSRYALALMLLLSPALVMAQDPPAAAPPAAATDPADPAAPQGLCASDPELQKIADSNPQVAQCCQQFDAMLGDINTVLSQGFTALVPVLGCLTLPPIELSSTCYNDLLSSGANCFNEMNVMLDFFNSSGLLDAALDAATGSGDNATIPTPEEFEKIALDYLPTAMDELKTITGSDQINPVCCQSVSKLVADKCACEKTPMSFLDGMLEKKGLKISDYIGLAKTVMGKMGCDAANDLQVYPQCTA
mmetsp:Transcript_8686/g.16108  ORF Transcript_8686/g.16108 Transcript_8686/m.16108 type:complete len:253 (-) Transcript_8686:2573-3331(-)